MNTFLLRNTLFILCALGGSLAFARAEVVHSSYGGPVGGNWGDPANWSPAIVPDNNGTQTFDVSSATEEPGINLDIDAIVHSFALTADYASLNSTDHNFTSGLTKVGVVSPNLYFSAETKTVVANLGDLAQFSGTTLHAGGIVSDTSYSTVPGLTSTIEFNGADIRTNNGAIGMFGRGARLVDEKGRDALANFGHNRRAGIFDIEQGRIFTCSGSLVNEGVLNVATSFDHIEGPELLTVNGDFTTIGFPLNPQTVGENILTAAGPLYDARMVIKGRLTNYDEASQTLKKSGFKWEAANGASATTKVMGGGRPMDIVISQASLNLYGPNTGLRDKFGNDALRNLAVSARLLMGDRNFTTAGSFASTSRLSIFGDTRFTISGHLTIRKGFFEVSPLTAYARAGDADFPTDHPYLSSKVIVRGNFSLTSESILRFHIFNTVKTAIVNVKGAAIFAGSLQAGVEKVSKISASDSFTVLTADRIRGQFSNVASGGRVDVFAAFDGLGNPIGNPIGTFQVTYTGRSLVLSDFQKALETPSEPGATFDTWSRPKTVTTRWISSSRE